jgi:hypothetical protein
MNLIKTTIKTHIVDNLINYVANKVSQEFTKKVNANLRILVDTGYIFVGIKKYANFKEEFPLDNGQGISSHYYTLISETTLPDQVLIENKDIYVKPIKFLTNKNLCKHIYEEHYANR